MLPPFDWTQLATQADLARLREDFSDLRSDFSDLRSEFSDLPDRFTGLRTEFDSLRVHLDHELAAHRADTRNDMTALELRIERQLRSQLRSIIYANATFMAAAGSLAFGLAQIA